LARAWLTEPSSDMFPIIFGPPCLSQPSQATGAEWLTYFDLHPIHHAAPN
jgi:hypothetical protein